MKRIWSILFFINFFLLLGLIKPSSVSSGYCTDAPIEGYKCWSAPGYACLSYWIHCYNTATCADGWGCSYDSCSKYCYEGAGSACLVDLSGGCSWNCNNTCSCTASCGDGWSATKPSTNTCSETFYCSCTDECGDVHSNAGSKTCYKSDDCSCTTTCGEGYYTTDTGPYCSKEFQCSCGTDCGNTKYGSKLTCYLPETNTATIPTPTWNKLKIGDRLSGNLSTNNSSPTRVPFPLSNTSTTESSTNIIANPEGSRELRYNFTIAGVLTTLTTNVIANNPTAASLTQGSTGSITTSYTTLNKCNDDTRTGSQLTTYYKVDYLPTVDTISSSLTISGYEGDDTTVRGCIASPSHTGGEVNNPLKVRIVAKDSDGSSDINGAFLWLVKNGSSIPSSYIDHTYVVGTGATSTDPNLIGIFVGLNDTRTVATIYKSNNSGGTLSNWGSDSGSTSVKTSSGSVIIQQIRVLSLTENALEKTYTFELELTFPTSSPIAGNYKFYTTATDKLIFYNSNTVELRTLYHNSNWQWNFDFVKPRIDNFALDVANLEQRLVDLTWVNNALGGSPIIDTVFNLYINPASSYSVTRTSPPPSSSITPSIKPDSANNIGLISPVTSGWYSNSSLQSSTINIGENGEGSMNFYTTIYDSACNYYTTDSTQSLVYDLNKWVATKGGIFFSDDTVNYEPKPIEFYTLGTELVTTKVGTYPSVRVIPEPNSFINPTLVKSVSDINDNDVDPGARIDFLYQKLYENDLGEPSGLNCYNEKGCKKTLTTIGVDGANTNYQGKIIIFSDQDINVYPNIVAGDSQTDGLIIFSMKNINILGGNTSTASNLAVDTIDALLMAKGQIKITSGTSDPEVQQDRVEVNGSLIAFGANEVDPAILIERNLRLQNTNKPVLNVIYHPKYAKISELFFGTETAVFKQEVGFKF